jgi:hypothetical protein
MAWKETGRLLLVVGFAFGFAFVGDDEDPTAAVAAAALVAMGHDWDCDWVPRRAAPVAEVAFRQTTGDDSADAVAAGYCAGGGGAAGDQE